MIVEVIATTLAEARVAEQAGADRIELIAGMREGGLTPALALVEQVVGALAIPVQVMIRPHSRSFCYDARERAAMAAAIRAVRRIGAAGIVVGVLTPERTIDRAALASLLDEAGDLSVTFHRAYDEIDDQFAALDTLLAMPRIARILTSGAQPSALDGRRRIADLVERSRHGALRILAGSGLGVDTIPAFVAATGVTELHLGRGVRHGSDPDAAIDPRTIIAIKQGRATPSAEPAR